MRSLFVSLGYRNVMRNKRRSLITGGVIAVGLASIILAHGFTNGFVNYMIKASTSDFFGQGRIRNVKYDLAQKSEYFIGNPKELISEISEDSAVKAVTSRTMVNAMVATPENSLNVLLVGIDPISEPKVSRLLANKIRGGFIGDDQKVSGIYLGEGIAKRLAVDVGGKLVLTTTKVSDSELVQELFRVRGIFSFQSKQMDEGFVFIDLQKSQKMLGMGAGVHEITVSFKDMKDIPAYESRFSKFSKRVYGSSDLEFKAWTKFLPSLKAMVEMTSESLGFVTLFMGLLVALAVANTLYMALYERIFEFGVIRAVGTRVKDIKHMVFFEALSLGVIGVFIGLVIVAALGGYLAIYGVDYRGVSYGTVTFRDPIYFEFSLTHIIFNSIGCVLFVGLVSLYPTRQIMKIATATALRSRG